MSLRLAAITLLASATTAAAQTPPLVQPGAPGAPTRPISAEAAVELSRGTFNAADVQFMQHMIVHHSQAVEMVALLQRYGADARVKLLGERIALSQEAEMALMRDWLIQRGQSTEMAGMDHGAHSAAPAADPHAGHDMAAMTSGGHDTHAAHTPSADEATSMRDHDMSGMSDTPLMPGMLSPMQMHHLSMARGAAFDRLFLQGMIQHHQGALDMVDGLMAQPGAANDPMLSEFTTSVIADQSAEILRMQSLLSDLQA